MGRDSRSLHTVKLAIVLPIVHCVLILALWEWAFHAPRPRAADISYVPTPILVGYGINAPALALKALADPVRLTNWAVVRLGEFRLQDILFFLGVALLWWLIGTSFDRWRSGEQPARLNPWKVVRVLVLVGIGVFLLGAGIDGLTKPWTHINQPGNLADQILFVGWGLVLIVLPGMELAKALWRKEPLARMPG